MGVPARHQSLLVVGLETQPKPRNDEVTEFVAAKVREGNCPPKALPTPPAHKSSK